MPEISLLEPMVLRGVIQQFTAPQTMVMLNKLPKTPWPYPTATWDVIAGSRNVARPNVPNSEAHIVPQMGRSQISAAFIYIREKKIFTPTLIHWIRTPGEIAARNAEQLVLRETQDLDNRFNAFAEWACWQALTGVMNLDFEDVQATVDYKFPTSHKIASPTVGWNTATPQQIKADVTAWKRLIQRDGRVPARQAFATEPTLARIIDSFSAVPALLSDRMKDMYYTQGTLPGFLGLDWQPVEHTYQTDAGVETLFLADDSLVIGNWDDNNPMEIFEGPTADDDAPDGYTGKFTKTWKEPDPSARQYLMEWNMMPVITRPEQFVRVADVAP